jgi:flavin-dependent dehydrogenase
MSQQKLFGGEVREIVVLGSGPAGAVIALMLSREGMRVSLVERLKAPPFKVGETLPGEAGAALAASGLRDVLKNLPALAGTGNRSAWGSPTPQERNGLLNPYGGGWHLDRTAFDTALVREAIETGVHFLPGTRITHASRELSRWRLAFDSTEGVRELGCDYVVDATGRRGSFACAQGVHRIRHDGLVGIVRVFGTAVHSDQDLWTTIESAQHGWWYTARIPLDRRVVIYFTDADLSRDCAWKREDSWLGFLSQTKLICQLVRDNRYCCTAPPLVVPADTSRLGHTQAEGWLAVGDAAAALDPLSSAGITEALKSANRAARVILNGVRTPLEIVDYSEETIALHEKQNVLRLKYYSMERRWRDSPFWARRTIDADSARR